MLFTGIDPGASGGLAVIDSRGAVVLATPLGGLTLKQLWDWFVGLETLTDPSLDAGDPDGTFASIEKVGGFQGEGQPGSAMFNFGKGVGHLEAFLTASRTPWEPVTPQAWQKVLGTGGKKPGEAKTQWKNRLKATAERLFPSTRVTLAVADALLIAEYSRRTRR